MRLPLLPCGFMSLPAPRPTSPPLRNLESALLRARQMAVLPSATPPQDAPSLEEERDALERFLQAEALYLGLSERFRAEQALERASGLLFSEDQGAREQSAREIAQLRMECITHVAASRLRLHRARTGAHLPVAGVQRNPDSFDEVFWEVVEEGEELAVEVEVEPQRLLPPPSRGR